MLSREGHAIQPERWPMADGQELKPHRFHHHCHRHRHNYLDRHPRAIQPDRWLTIIVVIGIIIV